MSFSLISWVKKMKTAFRGTRRSTPRGAVRTIRSKQPSLEYLEDRLTPTAIQWVGGSTGNWDAAANWSSSPSLPGASDDVIVNTATTITIQNGDNISVNSLTTASNDTLSFTGGSLSIAGNSTLSGAVTMSGGSLAASGSGSTITLAGAFSATGSSLTASGSGETLTATGTTSVSNSNLTANGGGTLSLPNLTSYAFNNNSFQAYNTGSVLDLSALTTITRTGNGLTIQPQTGGEVNLSALTTLPVGNVAIDDYQGGTLVDGSLTTLNGIGANLGNDAPAAASWTSFLNATLVINAGTYTLSNLTDVNGSNLVVSGGTLALPNLTSYAFNNNSFQAYNTGSVLDLSALTTITRTGNGLTIQPQTGGEVNLSALTTLPVGNVAIDDYQGGTLVDGSLTTLNGIGANLGNDAPAAASWTSFLNATLVINAGTYTLSNLTDVNGSNLVVSGGTLSLPNLTSYAFNNNSFQAYNTGSVLDLSALTTITRTGNGLTIQPQTGGEVNLSALTTLPVGNVAIDDYQGGTLVDGSLTTLNGIGANLGNDAPAAASWTSFLNATLVINAGTYTLSNLTDVNGSNLVVSGGTLSLPNLTSYAFNNNSFQAYNTGSVLDLSALTTITRTGNGLTIQPQTGGEVNLSALTTLPVGNVAIDDYQGGTLVDGSLTTLNGIGANLGNDAPAAASWTSFLNATLVINAGTYTLSNLTDVNGSNLVVSGGTLSLPNLTSYAFNNNSFQAYNTGSVLDLSALTTITRTGNGLTIQPQTGGEVNLSALTTLPVGNVAIDDYQGGTLVDGSLTTLNGIGANLGNDAPAAASWTSFLNATLVINAGTYTLSNLTDVNGSNLVVSGGTLALPNLTSYTGSNNSFQAYNTGSVLNLSALATNTGGNLYDYNNATLMLVFAPNEKVNLNASGYHIDASSTGTGSISGSVLNVTGVGSLVIDNPSNNTVATVLVSIANQTIDFTAPASPITFASNETVNLSATGGGSGNPVVFGIDASSTGTGNITGNTLTVTAAGTFVLDANQAGNGNYNAAPQVQQTLLVSNAGQTINFTAPMSPITFAPSEMVSLSATGGASGNAVVFSIDASSSGTGNITGNTLTVTGAGTFVLDANQAGNGNYNAAPQVQQTLLVSQAGQTINFTAPMSPITFAPSEMVSLSATGGASGNPVVFTIDASSTGTGNITGNTLTVTGAGTFVLDANQAGNGNYNAAPQVQQTLVVNPASPTVTAPSNQTATEGAAQSFDLGSFSDPDGGPWSVDVNWSDISADTTFTVTSAGSLGTQSHTFAEEGTYTVTVTVTNSTTNLSNSQTFQVSVADAALTITSITNPPATPGIDTGTVTVASFTDAAGSYSNINDLSATITWADGSTSAGTVVPTSTPGSYTVTGSHTYAAAISAGSTFSVAVNDSDGSSASQTINTTTASFGPISSPITQALASETIVFSAPVPGLTLADLSLTQSGSANLLTAAQTLTTTDNLTWTLGNLADLPSLTHRVAGFTLTLNTTGLTDQAGGVVVGPAPLSFIEVDAPLTLGGTTLTVPGTAGDDTFAFNAGASEQLSLNGVIYTIDPTLVSTVQFQGNGGSDTASLFAAGSHSTATLMPGAGTLQGSGYTVSVSGVTTLTVEAASASDYASFSASSGGIIYIGAPTFSRWIQGSLMTQALGFPHVAATGVAGDTAYLVAAPGQYLVATHDYSLLRTAADPLPANEVIGFSTVISAAAAGDTAYLFSTDANSHLIATPTTVDLITGGVVNDVRGFQTVVASSSSGSDSATFVDTVGSNAYVGTPGYSFLLNGQTQAQQDAIGFAFVYAVAPPGGNDTATLLDPTGNGGLNFLATPTYSLLRSGTTILNDLVGFPSVTAEVTAGGTDTAALYDAPGVAGLFDGGPTDAELRAGGYYVHTVGFAQVSVYATPGNQDTGYLANGPAGGTFYGQGNSAVLLGLPAFDLALYGFSNVIALGSTGPNHLSLAAVDYVFSDVGTWTPARAI